MSAVPAAPPAAEQVFGTRLPLAERYAELLVTTGIERGLLGPREADRVWERHLLNCAVIEELVPAGCLVVDIGSGAGLPGIPLALARPDLQVQLVEPLLRRTTWLHEVVEQLGITDSMTVVRARAEEVAPGVADVVTSRAVAPLSGLLPLSARLLRSGGAVVAIKGRSAADELAGVSRRCSRWKLEDARVAGCGHAVLDEPTTVVTARRSPS